MQLVIGNKNYSSWSMRPWLLMTHFGVEFEEQRIPLFQPGYMERLGQYSPTKRVPVLIDGGLTVWDSLSICEYVNEKYLDGCAYPEDLKTRSLCRSYCSEMHSGFHQIRTHLPMNCRARKALKLNSAIRAECSRIEQLWQQALDSNGGSGPYLFGRFSIADCFFAPVATRFRTYGIKLSPQSSAYRDTILETAAVRRWVREASAETEVLADFELGEALDPQA
ncbi:MAG: glutathione S-transferase family protein [Gammaproteobacteria bacterium]